MAEHKSIKRSGVLSRILRDEAGNTIAIMAAAVIPIIGLVGGAVDVSRIFLVQTKMQAACDAGSLMGRKVMGGGSWSDNSYRARDRADAMFDANFQDGEYGATDLSRVFTESGGNVTGTITATLPMTLMKALDQGDKTIVVDCEADQRIPNSDVMFVLDVTGSMGNAAPGSSESKISGLKKAVKCFYETLAKENITDVTPAQCGQSEDPDGGNSADVSLRFGFVNYSVNVNVGKLLPLDYLADSWSYQSREAKWDTGSGWRPVYGDESDLASYGTPTNSSGGNWNSWRRSNSNVTVNGVTYDRRFRARRSECNNTTAPPNQTINDTGDLVFEYQDPATPVYPTTTSVTRVYSQTDGATEYDYRYRYRGRRRCDLQYRRRNLGDTTNFFSSTLPVTWEQDQTFLGWDYKQVAFDVSKFKDTGNNAWRSNADYPLDSSGTDRSVYWKGCIEERQTARVNDSDPSDDWDPIPAAAKDLDIDLEPDVNDDTTRWGPALKDTVYARYWDGSRTTSILGPNDFDDDDEGYVYQYDPTCPTESKLNQQWSPDAFMNYINTLSAGGNTYHDIGLLWGARLMSPTGIFSSRNAPADTDIQRHMVFMTDGDTVTNINNYGPYGMNWWDRRQNQTGVNPSNDWLTDNVDARAQAICKWVKNQNITLWVVSYGAGVGTATDAKLTSCASPGKFFKATSVSDLVDQFKGIAAEISNLRLTG